MGFTKKKSSSWLRNKRYRISRFDKDWFIYTWFFWNHFTHNRHTCLWQNLKFWLSRLSMQNRMRIFTNSQTSLALWTTPARRVFGDLLVCVRLRLFYPTTLTVTLYLFQTFPCSSLSVRLLPFMLLMPTSPYTWHHMHATIFVMSVLGGFGRFVSFLLWVCFKKV